MEDGGQEVQPAGVGRKGPGCRARTTAVRVGGGAGNGVTPESLHKEKNFPLFSPFFLFFFMVTYVRRTPAAPVVVTAPR